MASIRAKITHFIAASGKVCRALTERPAGCGVKLMNCVWGQYSGPHILLDEICFRAELPTQNPIPRDCASILSKAFGVPQYLIEGILRDELADLGFVYGLKNKKSIERRDLIVEILRELNTKLYNLVREFTEIRRAR